MHKLTPPIIAFCKKHARIIFYIGLLAIILPEITVYFHKPARGADIFGYLAAGHDALALNDLYANSAPGKNNTWPPFFSFFISPLAFISDIAGIPFTKIIWYFVNFTALILSMKIISILLYDKNPSLFKPSTFSFTSDKVFVPALLVLPALINNFFMLQINALIMFLVFYSLLLDTNKKPVKAGFFLALAASIKAYPGLFLIYLLFRKKWKTSIYTMIFGVLLTISPVVFYGIDGFIDLFKNWLSLSFSKPFIIGYTTFNNHSLYAFWERLLAHQLHITTPASQMIKLFNVSSILVILISSFTVLLRFAAPDRPVLRMIEFSVISTMMILFPPIAWVHYWIIMLPAAATIYYCARMIPESMTLPIRIMSITSLLLIQIPYFFSKSIIQKFLKMHSCYTFSSLLALLVLLLLFMHPKVRTFTAVPDKS
jgi:hypothetical protein